MATNYGRRFYLTLALVAAFGGAYFFRHEIAGLPGGKNHAGKMQTENTAEVKPAKKERKILYWTDTMIPGFRAPGPGKSPMGMDMTPVYEDEADAAGGVKINPEIERSIGVRTGKAVVREVSKTIRAAGIVSYDERKVSNIQAKVAGWVEKLYVNFTGQEVREGDYLMEMYSPELVASEEEFLLAVKTRAIEVKNPIPGMEMGSDEMYQASRKRLEYLDVPKHQIWDIEFKRQIYKTLHLHTPVAGVVVSKPIFVGMQVTPGMTLYTIADLSTVWVMADVYEYEIGSVRIGDRVTMTLPAYPGRTFTGSVMYINPFVEKETRTVKVRMEFHNLHRELKPEMFATVELHTRARKKALTVPKEAVIRSGERDIVIVSRGAGIYAPREVTLGIEGRDYFEITNGLAEGETVVSSANFLIDSESNLREAAAKMISPAGRSAQTPTPAIPAATDHAGMEGMDMGNVKMDHSAHDHAGHDHSADTPPPEENTTSDSGRENGSQEDQEDVGQRYPLPKPAKKRNGRE